MKDKLNLGCGFDILEDYHNVDINGVCDERVDLSVYPWPWSDGSFVHILANDLVEHLPAGSLIRFMDECHRILGNDGIIEIRTPTPEAPFFYIDPTHVRPYLPETFHFFDPSTDFGKKNDHLTDKKWEIISNVVLNYNICVELRKL